MTDTQLYQFQLPESFQSFTINLNDDQINGICAAAYAVYGNEGSRNFKFGIVEDGQVRWDTVGELLADEVFALADDQSHYDNLPEMASDQSWLSYLQTIEDNLDTTDIESYTAILRGKGWVLVKFSNLQFLEGIIGLCDWAKIDWKHVLHQLHYQETPIDMDRIKV